ncbi:MAG TPA: hypothetical protein VF554_16885 [Thermoanaerobaculia bacterium]
MADDTVFRREAVAHIGAGCLVVTAIAGLLAAFLSPVVLGALSRGNREAALSAGGVLAFSLAFALAIWLLFYLPSSLAAGVVTKNPSARLWLSVLICMIGVGTASLFVLQPAHAPLRIVAALQYSIILGLGCALYSFLRRSFSRGH